MHTDPLREPQGRLEDVRTAHKKKLIALDLSLASQSQLRNLAAFAAGNGARSELSVGG